MKNLLLRSFKLTLWGLFFFYSSKSIYAQKQILFDGELKIYAGYSTLIKVEAVSVVWGIWQDNYPIRSDLRCTYEITDHSCEFDHVGDNNGRPLVGYGRYKITIDNHSTFVDFRDCDYLVSVCKLNCDCHCEERFVRRSNLCYFIGGLLRQKTPRNDRFWCFRTDST